MTTQDFIIDLGNNTATRLSLILAVVPAALIAPESRDEGANAYVILKNGLGVMPFYQTAEEIYAWFQDYARYHLDLGMGHLVDVRSIAAVLPADALEMPDGAAKPACIVQCEDNNAFPSYKPYGEVVFAMQGEALGFFG